MVVAWTREVLVGRKRGKPLPEKGRNFPGSPVVKTSPSSVGAQDQSLVGELRFPHAPGPKNQNIKQKLYCNKFNKDFKNEPRPKKRL